MVRSSLIGTGIVTALSVAVSRRMWRGTSESVFGRILPAASHQPNSTASQKVGRMMLGTSPFPLLMWFAHMEVRSGHEAKR